MIDNKCSETNVCAGFLWSWHGLPHAGLLLSMDKGVGYEMSRIDSNTP